MPVHSGRTAPKRPASGTCPRCGRRFPDRPCAPAGRVTKRPPSSGQHFGAPDSKLRAGPRRPCGTTCWHAPRPPAVPRQPARHPLQHRQHAQLVASATASARSAPPNSVRRSARVRLVRAVPRPAPSRSGGRNPSCSSARGTPCPVRSNSSARPPLRAASTRGRSTRRSPATGSTSATTLAQLAGALQRGDIFPKIPIHDSICSFLTHCHTGPEYPSAHIPYFPLVPARVTLRRNAHPGKPFPDSLTHDRRRPDDRPQNAMLGRIFSRIGPVPSGTGVLAKPTRSDVLTIPAMPSGYRPPAGKSRYSYPCASYSRDSDSKRLRKSG